MTESEYSGIIVGDDDELYCTVCGTKVSTEKQFKYNLRMDCDESVLYGGRCNVCNGKIIIQITKKRS